MMDLEIYRWNRGYLVRVGMLVIFAGKRVDVAILANDAAATGRAARMRAFHERRRAEIR